MPLLLLIFLWFIAEIVAFIYIGGAIGIGETIVEVIATIVIGVWLIKYTARSAMKMGIGALMNGGLLISRVVGGILLVIPGFLTDFLGLLAIIAFPFGIILTILGLGRKPDLQGFMREKMMSGAFGGGKNPFGNMGANPFNDNQSNTNKDGDDPMFTVNMFDKEKQNPFAGNPIFEEMVKKQQANKQNQSNESKDDKVIDGEVINKKD